MAFTAADVTMLEAEIRAAIADGSWRVKSVSFADGQNATLHTLEEAMAFLARIRREVAAATAAAAGTNPHVRWAIVDKGF